MFHKSTTTTTTRKGKSHDHHGKSHFNPQYKARSTSQLLSPNAIIHHSISPLKSDYSTPHASTSSLANSTITTPTAATVTNTAKNNLSSLFKIPLSHRKTTVSQSSEDRYLMTLIKSPVDTTAKISSNESTISSPTTEESPTNGKLFKNKVTAAFNHMKYRS